MVSDEISIIDNEAHEILGRVRLGDAIRPRTFALTPDGRYVFLASPEPGLLTILDTAS